MYQPSQGPNKNFAYDENNTATQPVSETTAPQPDSIVEACLPFADLLGGEIVHVSFDCPENLRTAFNSATKANGTSTCHVLRTMIEIYVVSNHYQKACFSNTMKPVVIKQLVMPTYVKQRHRRLKPVEEEVTEAVELGKCAMCGRRAYVWATDSGGSRLLCEADFLKVRSKSHLLNWKHLEDSTS